MLNFTVNPSTKGITMTKLEYRFGLQLTRYKGYLSNMDELWDVFCENLKLHWKITIIYLVKHTLNFRTYEIIKFCITGPLHGEAVSFTTEIANNAGNGQDISKVPCIHPNNPRQETCHYISTAILSHYNLIRSDTLNHIYHRLQGRPD